MYILHTLPHHFIVDIDVPHPPPTCLLIDRLTKKCVLTTRKAISASSASSAQALHTEKILGLYGMVTLVMDTYLILIVQARQVATLINSTIKLVTQVKLVPFSPFSISSASSDHSDRSFSASDEADEARYLHLIHHYIQHTKLYFTYDSDLTNSIQRTLNHHPPALPPARQADRRFFWNFGLNEELFAIEAYLYILPIINGYVYHHHVHIGQEDVTFVVISRRSVDRAGKRFTRRGLDTKGNAANFDETEQIIVSNNNQDRATTLIHSFLQSRGSIPLLWEQPVNLKYTPKIIVNPNNEENEMAFKMHMEDQIQRYSRVICVNLINQKGAELVLMQAFTSLVNKYNAAQEKKKRDTNEAIATTNPLTMPVTPAPHSLSSTVSGTEETKVKLINWDFHKECHKMKYNNVTKLIDLIGESEWNQMGYLKVRLTSSLVNGKRVIEHNVLREQASIIRTNCIDCLDRTNVVQAALAKYVLTEQLASLNIPLQSRHILPSSLNNMFNACWANNADAMSLQYSGTGALKTDFTRTGKRSLRGAVQDGVNSLTRYFLNNFYDGQAQDTIDLVLGHYQPRMLPGSLFAHDDKRSVPEFFARIAVALLIIFALYHYLVPHELAKPWTKWPVAIQFAIYLALVGIIGSKLLLRYGSMYVDKPRAGKFRSAMRVASKNA